MRTRRGQAMMELAAGMFAITLIVSSLCAFAVFMAKSLKVQNSLRSSAPQPSGEKVPLGDFLYGIVGQHHLFVDERVSMPPTSVAK